MGVLFLEFVVKLPYFLLTEELFCIFSEAQPLGNLAGCEGMGAEWLGGTLLGVPFEGAFAEGLGGVVVALDDLAAAAGALRHSFPPAGV